MEPRTSRRGDWAFLIQFIAAGLILGGGLANNITLASGSYLVIVAIAIIATLAGSVALIFAWSISAIYGRVTICLLGMVAGWTLVDAVGRRLPLAAWRLGP